MTEILCPYCDLPLDEKYFCTTCNKNFHDEVIAGEKEEILNYQIEQQDRIDNACYHLIKEFAPDAEWDIQQISVVREALVSVLTESFKMKSFDLYPWILSPEN